MKSLWEEHKSRLRGSIAKRVRDKDAVDDILQDVYLKASVSLSRTHLAVSRSFAGITVAI